MENNERKDGGAAFPHSDFQDNWNTTHGASAGMSLRDYFAARALPGVQAEYAAAKEGAAMTRHDYEDIAADAYVLADALLNARSA